MPGPSWGLHDRHDGARSLAWEAPRRTRNPDQGERHELHGHPRKRNLPSSAPPRLLGPPPHRRLVGRPTGARGPHPARPRRAGHVHHDPVGGLTAAGHRVGSLHERPAGDGHRGGVRHLGAGPAHGQPDGGLLAGRQRLRLGDRTRPPRPLGLRGGVAAARRPRLRHVAPGRRPQPAHRRGHGAGQRHPHQRRPPVRRPRPPRVLHARGDHPARHRALGQGGGAGDARRLPPGRPAARRRADHALQEQHRQQGSVVRRPRELPDAPVHAVRRHRAAPHAVLRQPPGRVRRGARGDRPGRPRAGLPDQPARRLLRGRGRASRRP